jgi:release factor glutamine methyltransferase
MDKPEENIDSTLKALWLTSSGSPKSAEEAVKMQLSELDQAQIVTLHDLVTQRLDNKPLAHITGRQSFMGIEFLSDRRALIPRKETEILGWKALELSLAIAERKDIVNVIDMCCGAGNLGLAIAQFNANAVVFAADLSQEAVDLTTDNITFLGLNKRVCVKQGDMFSSFASNENFNYADLIVCNPPYISSAKVPKMSSEISNNEPVLAFDGGMLGTNIIVKLIQDAPEYLAPGGWLIFEIGLGQGPFILNLCERSDSFVSAESVKDESGNIRTILAQKA